MAGPCAGRVLAPHPQNVFGGGLWSPGPGVPLPLAAPAGLAQPTPGAPWPGQHRLAPPAHAGTRGLTPQLGGGGLGEGQEPSGSPGVAQAPHAEPVRLFLVLNGLTLGINL